jgi:hypothetical protein
MAKRAKNPNTTRKQPERYWLTPKHCQTYRKAMREFGYDVSLAEVERIAKEVAMGTHSLEDPVALILVKQIDEAFGPPASESHRQSIRDRGRPT